MAWYGLILALVLSALACLASYAGDDLTFASDSVSRSKRRHLFMGMGAAEPPKVLWNGHTVSFAQVWLEQGVQHDGVTLDRGGVRLCCACLVDGRREKGSLSKQSSFELVPNNSAVNKFGSPTINFATLGWFNRLQRLRYEFGLGTGILHEQVSMTHIIFMPSSNLPSEVVVHLAAPKEDNVHLKMVPLQTIDVTVRLPANHMSPQAHESAP